MVREDSIVECPLGFVSNLKSVSICDIYDRMTRLKTDVHLVCTVKRFGKDLRIVRIQTSAVFPDQDTSSNFRNLLTKFILGYLNGHLDACSRVEQLSCPTNVEIGFAGKNRLFAKFEMQDSTFKSRFRNFGTKLKNLFKFD